MGIWWGGREAQTRIRNVVIEKDDKALGEEGVESGPLEGKDPASLSESIDAWQALSIWQVFVKWREEEGKKKKEEIKVKIYK